MRRKIALILPNLDENGGQIVTCTLLKNMNREKYQVSLFVLSPYVKNRLTLMLQQENVPVNFVKINLDYNYVRSIEILYWLDNSIKKYEPDIIHVHLDTLYTWFWAIIRKKYILFTIHSEAKRIYNRISGFLFQILKKKNLITVIGVSKGISKHFCEVFGAESAITIYNPVEISNFKCERNTNENKNEIRFVHVARFSPVKNHKLLINSFAQLHKMRKNTSLMLIGDGQNLHDIKMYVSQLHLNKSIKFIGAVDDVTSFLKQSDVFVLSSKFEAFPVSVLEAMAAGLPIISTKVGGLPEVVRDNGILVEPENVNELANAMQRLVDDKKLRVKMGMLSKKYVEQYSVENIIKQYEQLYDRT